MTLKLHFTPLNHAVVGSNILGSQVRRQRFIIKCQRYHMSIFDAQRAFSDLADSRCQPASCANQILN
ncbi:MULTISPECIES: hypothetical protein [Nostocales]|uniref:hypothetical protein n=1 Tax=Nostocales TaxID=1161 RepID=UPI001684D058|nr:MULTISPECIES: hypothetical protein [Nostocales]MBD2303484.1 hypothetical protein [Nostoc sp. FACHB-190]MBD2491226.1 hypothetical protein [Aulosira sp. FACHB-615]